MVDAADFHSAESGPRTENTTGCAVWWGGLKLLDEEHNMLRHAILDFLTS